MVTCDTQKQLRAGIDVIAFQISLSLILMGAAALIVRRRRGQRALMLLIVAAFALMGHGVGKWLTIYATAGMSMSYYASGGGEQSDIVRLCELGDLQGSEACACALPLSERTPADPACLLDVMAAYRNVMVERQWRWQMVPWLAPPPCAGEYAIYNCQERMNALYPPYLSTVWTSYLIGTLAFTVIGIITGSVVYQWGRPRFDTFVDAAEPESGRISG